MARITTRGDVSVVIPTCNRHELLEVTLAAVLDQRGVDLEVLVVDDGSHVEVATHGWVRDPRVQVIRHPTPRGVAAARNAGIEAATKQWLAFTDDDDIWAPDKLASQLEALAEQPAARWSCTGAVLVDDDLNVFRSDAPPERPHVADLLLLRNPIPGGASSVVAERTLVQSLGGFDESLSICADYDLWIRLALAAQLASVHRPLVAYRVHEGGMSRSLDDVDRELDVIGDKYADECALRNLAPSDQINLWIADRHQRSGRRLPAARAYLRSTDAIGLARAAGRALEGLMWPGAFRHRDARRARRVPRAWATEAREWLDPLRERHRRGGPPGGGDSDGEI